MLTRDELAWALDEQREDTKRLVLEPQFQARAPEFPRDEIQLEGSEPDGVGKALVLWHDRAAPGSGVTVESTLRSVNARLTAALRADPNKPALAVTGNSPRARGAGDRSGEAVVLKPASKDPEFEGTMPA